MKDQLKIQTPKLRFPKFHDAWDEVPLSVLAVPISDRAGTSECVPYTVKSGVGLLSQEEKLGRTIAGKSLGNYIRLQKDDFAYNKSATKAFPEGYIARYFDDVKAAVPNSIFTCFRADPSKVDPAYLDFLFASNLHGRWLRRFLTIGARAHGSLNVSDDDLMALPVPRPSLAEQREIAACLTSLTELLATAGRKLEGLRAHRKGLMQQLFPRPGESCPRLRFPEFRDAGPWQEKRLDELAKRGTGHTPNKAATEYYNGGIKWISLADSSRLDKGLISETAIEISQQGINNCSAVLHPAGTVVLSRDAGVGKSGVMGLSMAVSQHFVTWTCHDQRLSNWFLYYVLQLLKPEFESIATGSTIKTIGMPFFTAMRVTVPEFGEQQRIAACLGSLDTLIVAASRKLEGLRTHKMGLTHRLFPSPAQESA